MCALFNFQLDWLLCDISCFYHLFDWASSSLKLDGKGVIMLGVGINIFDDEGRKELIEEFARNLLHSFTINALLKKASFQDITPPSLHVGCHTGSEALLVSSFLELSMKDINDIVIVGRHKIDLSIAELIADINIVLLEN